jgi:CRP-like cAMP-binding protein
MTSRPDGRGSPFILHLRSGVQLSQAEASALESLERGARTLPRDTCLETEGQPLEQAYVIKEGWAIRHKDLRDGRRQVLDFVLPGDIVGPEGCVQPVADHSVTALTDLTATAFGLHRLEQLTREQPRVVTALVWVGARQRAVFAEHLLSLGRRTATERVAHVLLEIWRRLAVRGLCEDYRFRLPVTQAVLADTLGLSHVHVNRCLRDLGRGQLIGRQREMVSILDVEGLVSAAQFDASYLDGLPMPEDLRRAAARPDDGALRSDEA